MPSTPGSTPSRLPEALAGGFADSIPLQLFVPRMVQGIHSPPLGHIATMLKDLDTVVDVARDTSSPVPMAALAAQLFRLAKVGARRGCRCAGNLQAVGFTRRLRRSQPSPGRDPTSADTGIGLLRLIESAPGLTVDFPCFAIGLNRAWKNGLPSAPAAGVTGADWACAVATAKKPIAAEPGPLQRPYASRSPEVEVAAQCTTPPVSRHQPNFPFPDK